MDGLKAVLVLCSAAEASIPSFYPIQSFKTTEASLVSTTEWNQHLMEAPLLTCIVFFLSGVCVSVRADRLTV